jgi:hypothetical protein
MKKPLVGIISRISSRKMLIIKESNIFMQLLTKCQILGYKNEKCPNSEEQNANLAQLNYLVPKNPFWDLEWR